MDKIKSEADRITGMHQRFKIQMDNFSNDIIEIEKKTDELEMKFYLNGNDVCISHYDNYLLASFELTRKMDKERILKNQNCWAVVPFSFRPPTEFQWSVKSAEALSEYKKFFECAKGYNERIVSLYKEKADLKKNIMKKLIEFNKE